MFYEVCLYEARVDRQDEIEALMRDVAEFYRSQLGVIDVKYIKRTHRQDSFQAVKDGELPIRLTRYVGKVTYVLFWTLESPKAHVALCKPALERFYKRWNRCLMTMPKIILARKSTKPPPAFVATGS